MFEGPFATSMLKKAQDNNLAEIRIHDLRGFGIGPRRTVDDTPYGGGDGMVLRPEPIFAAVEKLKARESKVIFLTPAGEKYDQALAQKLAKTDHLILVCGHYEGFDERCYGLADLQLSVGDFVMTGGEIPAMAVVDSVVRLIPGVLGGEKSADEESFSEGLLEYPQYTKPDDFREMKVPEVLKSGNHAEIKKWRYDQSVEKTKKFRPDLLQ